MIDKKVDLRIIRTKKYIRESFLKLLKEKRYEKITIQEIAKDAMINRNTFYLHYEDKEALLLELSNECLKELEESLKYSESKIDNLKKEDIYETFKAVFETIEKNIIFYEVIMSDNGIPCFSERFKDIIRKHISQGINKIELLKISDKFEKELQIEYMVSGFVGVVSLWINNNPRYSSEEIANILFNIHYKNIIGLF